MKVEFDKSFEKSLNKIRNKSLYPRIEKIILECEKASSITELQNGWSQSASYVMTPGIIEEAKPHLFQYQLHIFIKIFRKTGFCTTCPAVETHVRHEN